MGKFRLGNLFHSKQVTHNQPSSSTSQAASKSSILSRLKAKLTFSNSSPSSQSTQSSQLADFVPVNGRTRANAFLVNTRGRSNANQHPSQSTTLSTVSQQPPVLPQNSPQSTPSLMSQRSSSSISVSSTTGPDDTPSAHQNPSSDSPDSPNVTSLVDVGKADPSVNDAKPDSASVAKSAIHQLQSQIENSKLSGVYKKRAGDALNEIEKTIDQHGLPLPDAEVEDTSDTFWDVKDWVSGDPELHDRCVQLSHAVLDEDGDVSEIAKWAGSAPAPDASAGPQDQPVASPSQVTPSQIPESSPDEVSEPEISVDPQATVDDPQNDAEQQVPLNIALKQFTKYLNDPRAKYRLGNDNVSDATLSLNPQALEQLPREAAIDALAFLGMHLDKDAKADVVSAAVMTFMKEVPLERPQDVPSASANGKLDAKQQTLVNSICENAFGIGPEQLKVMVADLLNLPKEAVNVMNVSPTNSPHYGQGISIQLMQKSGVVEKMVVSFYPKQDQADHNGHLDLGVIRLEKGKQGGGAAKKMFKGVLGLMKKSRLETMSLEANITVGGYLWARMGFHPADGAFGLHGRNNEPPKLGSVKGNLQSFLDAVDSGKTKVTLSKSQRKHLKSIISKLDNPDTVDSRAMIRELTQLSTSIPLNELPNLFPADRAERLAEIAGDGGQKKLTLGKALLLGTSWDGTFKAKGSNNDMGHMTKYVMKNATKKFALPSISKVFHFKKKSSSN